MQNLFLPQKTGKVEGEIELLTGEEKHKLLIEWNDTAEKYQVNKCIHDLFREQVNKIPDCAACMYENQTLTYRELDNQSTGLAGHLQKMGIHRDCLAGICLERSLEMMVGILAILKAGGGYVPIDAGYPAERIKYMLEDSNARILVTSASLEKKLKKIKTIPETIFMDSFHQLSHSSSHSSSQCLNFSTSDSTALAYVIYTSGSTGKPKGVAVEHRAVVNYLELVRKKYNAAEIHLEEFNFVFLGNFCFDATATSFLTPLIAGSICIIYKQQDDQQYLFRKALNDPRVQVIKLTPSHLQLIRGSESLGLKSRKLLIIGGEPLKKSILQELMERSDNNLYCINQYGPSECTIAVSAHLYRPDLNYDTGIYIGRPIANTRIYILDQENTLQPIGSPGEIHIAGIALARGYLNQPELTKEKFINNPFQPGTNMYKTGDIARWLPEQHIEFLGRRDDQVKIRGFRIECGEIEAVLAGHPGIRQAVVLARTMNDNTHLAAFYVLDNANFNVNNKNEKPQANEPGAEEIKDYLRNLLPEYMIPTTFMPLNSIPLTPNGKVDRQALAQLGANPLNNLDYKAPITNEQVQLCQIWEDLFGFKPIGIRDNFFNLGGNSLLVGQLKIRVKESFGKVISFPDIYQNPVIEALAGILHGLTGEDSQFPPIKRLNKKNGIPLSAQQEQVWFLCTLAPDNRAYNFHFSLRFQGKFNQSLFESCLTEIIRRHEIFRTTFPGRQGKPVQVIHEPWEVRLPVVDFRHIKDKEERERQLEKSIRQELDIVFDVTELPLICFKVFLLEEQEFLFLQIEYHFVHDGWSNAVFLQELKTLYAAYDKGEKSPLPELPIQFSDYTAWQREWLDGDLSGKQLDYWIQTLEGCPTTLELSTDMPRPKIQSFKGDFIRIYFPDDLYQGLRRFCRERRTTLFVTLFSAFAILLHFYTEQEDLLIGTALVNRRLKETRSLIGMLVNSLALPIKIHREQLVSNLLTYITDVVLQAHENQEIPVGKIIRTLFKERDPSRNPLFQVMFSFHDSPIPDIELAGLKGEYRFIHNGTAKNDINVVCLPRAEQRIGMEKTVEQEKLEVHWEFNTAIFRKETMETMINHYLKILEDMLDEKKERVSHLDMMGAEERKKILYDFNKTATEFPEEQCIHELFREQAKKNPGNIAVVFAHQEITYRELDKRSTSLAFYLQTQGVKPDTLVGICPERSLEMIVAILGVFKAGGAYVPIDPEYPEARIGYMLENAGLKILLTQETLKEKVYSLLHRKDCRIVALDSDWKNITGTAGKLKSVVRPHHLAYVIYTSGSTGKPKGAANCHRGFINLVTWYCRTFHAAEQDKVICFSPVGFDLTQKNFIAMLIVGGRLYLVPGFEPEVINQTIFKNRITWLNCAPSAFYALIEHSMETLLSLRIVLLGGEAFQLERLEKWRCYFKANVLLVNTYGPTESSDVVTFYEASASCEETSIPIGKPVYNTQIYILNALLKPVPIGVSGELHIAGTGLARGYLNHAELTKEKFIPNPFKPGTRMYKTGDLARWLSNRNIEFLGRSDYQVKVRGFRIECGEIEAELAQHPAIREAVVIAREFHHTTQLIAYYATKDKNQVIEVIELRRYLQAKLPDYMIPAAFVSLEAIPLSPNGKVDRKYLSKQEVKLQGSQEYTAPGTGIEKQLTRIWEEVLGVARIGIYDNFFDLGGHSLLAIQIISRINKELGVNVLLHCLIETPYIEGLSGVIAGISPYQSIPIGSIQRPEQLPLSYAQERLWFLAQMGFAKQYHIPRIIQIKGDLDIEALQKSLNFIAARHESLRTAFKTVDGQAVQVIAGAVDIGIEPGDLSGLSPDEQEQERKAIINEFVQRPFDLSQAPLIRVVLITMRKTTHILGMCLHHIIADAWSMGILMKELTLAYAAYRKGEEPGPEKLMIRYADYTIWQREVMTAEKLGKILSSWKEHLDGYENLNMPGDFPRPKQLSGNGGHVHHLLEKEFIRSLKNQCQEMRITLFTVLITSVYILLQRYSRQVDICLGFPVANRNRQEIEDIVGFFLNTLVVRIDIEKQPAIKVWQLLKNVHEEIVMAQDRQEVPFEKLVEALQPSRDLSRTPIFQVLVNYVNAGREELQLGDSQLEEVDYDYDISKFDLTFAFLDQTDGGIRIKVEYSRDLYQEATIKRMIRHLIEIITCITEETGKAVDEITLLTEEEKQKLLVEWNDTAAGYPSEQCIHELFQEQVKTTADTIALGFENHAVSYRELEERSTCLALVLQRQGVTPDRLVGICLERSIDMVVGLMGILKAGGAYVPLDPDYPAERLEYMLRDSGVPLIITQAGLTGKISQRLSNTTRMIVQDLHREPVEKKETNAARTLKPGIQSHHTAYVIYTSGSTGKPKGVMISHRALTNFLITMSHKPGLNHWDQLLAVTTYCFDIAGLELYLPLINGAQSYICNAEQTRDAELLMQVIHKIRPTIMQATPATWTMLFSAGWKNEEKIKVLCGGEALPGTLRQHFIDTGSESWNMFGPTETTIWSTIQPITAKEPITIGKPIANTRIYILDSSLKITPIGIPGELYIAGDGLARGYLNRPELTYERFINYTLQITTESATGESEESGETSVYLRLYRTGDLARWLSNGNIEFLGRSDHQVKVRGFRIECGEVEAELAQHPAIREAVVLARELNNSTQLVAHVVPVEKDNTIETGKIRDYLKVKLPDYMIPAAFVSWAAIPLTPNGKVDRKALQMHEPELQSSRKFVPPRTDMEKQITAIWENVLGIEKVGIYDNFFELGGHSLLATRIISRINSELGAVVPLEKLFDAPDIVTLSGIIAECRHTLAAEQLSGYVENIEELTI